jgi:hypothetical protein
MPGATSTSFVERHVPGSYAEPEGGCSSICTRQACGELAEGVRMAYSARDQTRMSLVLLRAIGVTSMAMMMGTK